MGRWRTDAAFHVMISNNILNIGFTGAFQTQCISNNAESCFVFVSPDCHQQKDDSEVQPTFLLHPGDQRERHQAFGSRGLLCLWQSKTRLVPPQSKAKRKVVQPHEGLFNCCSSSHVAPMWLPEYTAGRRVIRGHTHKKAFSASFNSSLFMWEILYACQCDITLATAGH